jgi:hypothetical protein
MEKLYFNLSEEEFSKSRKILLWVFVVLFFIGGIYVALLSPVFGLHSIKPILSVAPFGISLIVGIVAVMATMKRKDIYFLIDDDKIEFRYGLFRPKKHSFPWNDIKEIVMPHQERKAKLMFNDSSSFVIDLSYIQRRKSSIIRKHIYHAACYQKKKVIKVVRLHGIKS